MIYKLPYDEITHYKGHFDIIGYFKDDVYIYSSEDTDEFIKLDTIPDEIKHQYDGLVESKRKHWKQVWNDACHQKLSHFESDALGKVHIYDLDIEDQINLMALVNAGIASNFRCTDKDTRKKDNYPHTVAQLKKVYQDGFKWKQKYLELCAEGKSLIDTLDLSEISALKHLIRNSESNVFTSKEYLRKMIDGVLEMRGTPRKINIDITPYRENHEIDLEDIHDGDDVGNGIIADTVPYPHEELEHFIQDEEDNAEYQKNQSSEDAKEAKSFGKYESVEQIIGPY